MFSLARLTVDFSSIVRLQHNALPSRAFSVSLFRPTALDSTQTASNTLEENQEISINRRPSIQDLSASWPEGIKKFLEREKITEPTLIQQRTFSIALENKNLVGVARTGSGKTLAFAIPAIMKILESRANERSPNVDSHEDDNNSKLSSYREQPMKPPKCLVMVPTRELAGQINDVFDKFRHMRIKSIALVGGGSRSDQIRQLMQSDFDVYVATPGRLMDLIESNVVDLSAIEYLVLDEADRMLDMGFEPQIRKILTRVPEKRQTLMWSATWPQEIQSLASEFLNQYEYVAVDSENLKANPNIKQVIKICEPHKKLDLLLQSFQEFKEEHEQPRILVFVNTKRLADQLIYQMMRNRIKAISMHGDRSQKQRDDALRLFKNRMCHVLVATDVAARGLDISDITHVVNFDIPNTIEDYIHRIGRTARHERTGTAVSFFTENDSGLARKLIEVLKETKQEVPNQLREMAGRGQRQGNRDLMRGHVRSDRPRRTDFYTSGGTFKSRNRFFDDF